MKAVLLLFDSLNRHFLPNYGCDWTKMPNFQRLEKRAITFERFYAGSLPCMPARRELHTGRYNFLHSSWCPMEPFDDSLMSRMKAAGIYSHIATDHFHYWEDGGSGYLSKFDSHQMIRGQQGDPWMGQVAWPDFPETLSRRCTGENWRHDWVNRSFLKTEEEMPQKKTFECGIDFIRRNKNEDRWFLQIEAFDPHEPFYSQKAYKDLYPHDYHGKNLDWPDYGENDYGEEATNHVRMEYAALLSMCDHYLGQLLDTMDEWNLWQDTMLIVGTDHGFMLGEKEWMGKNVQPMYEEISHIPCFIYDPRYPECAGQRRYSLAQTVDLVPTLADYFQIAPPDHMDGKNLRPVICDDRPVRDAALFGIFGGHVNVTDGRYVYMKGPHTPENGPLYEYTLMPNHMREPFSLDELRQAELQDGFPYMNGSKVMVIPAEGSKRVYGYGDMLFDLEQDPRQEHPISSSEITERLTASMKKMMEENEAPREQFLRLWGKTEKEERMENQHWTADALLYDNPLSSEDHVAGFRLEGEAEISFPDGRMRIRNTMDESKGQAANIVYWCPEDFPENIRITWDFWPLREKGLCILFFGARGRNGEDLFDPSLAKRTGEYQMYHSGDINALHISYYRRMYESERAFHLANLRKSYGFHLVAQGADPIPYPPDARPPYRLRVDKYDNITEFFINDLFIFRFEDDGETYGPVIGGGKIGFRQMSPMIGEYANLRVWQMKKR